MILSQRQYSFSRHAYHGLFQDGKMDSNRNLNFNKCERHKVTLENTEQWKLRSKFIDQEYILQIYIPPIYTNSSRSFPVLYLLDSDKSFGMAKDIVEWLIWCQEIPEIIIVGIAYGEGVEQWWQKRSRDYTPTKDKTRLWGDFPLAGGARDFLRFFKVELVPFIDAHYPTKTDDRTIIGLSIGGLFGAYTMLADPSLFRRYIMISPAFIWDDGVLFNQLTDFMHIHNSLNATIYSVIGDLDEKDNIIKPWKKFFDILGSEGLKGLNYSNEVVVGETHISIYPHGMTRGLKYVFSDR